MGEPLIAMSRAGAAHAGAPIFVDAELVVAGGEAVLVGGPAGAGATTLVERLTGRAAGAGTVALAGRDLAKLRASSLQRLRRRMGVVAQDLALFPGLSALANVAVALEIAGVGRSERDGRAREALAAVDVPADRTVASLAMAARQRVAWARAFVRKPDILIADQPTSHQDGEGAERFAELIAERLADGAAAVVCARDPHLCAAAARRGWRALVIHDRALVDPARLVPEELDATPYVEVEIPRPAAVAVADEADAIEAIPNVLPFPRVRSAGHRR